MSEREDVSLTETGATQDRICDGVHSDVVFLFAIGHLDQAIINGFEDKGKRSVHAENREAGGSVGWAAARYGSLSKVSISTGCCSADETNTALLRRGLGREGGTKQGSGGPRGVVDCEHGD